MRLTPRALAAAVIFKPEGSMHSSKTTVPGCGGFFIGMAVSIHPANRILEAHTH
jgi:hypothetical protein